MKILICQILLLLVMTSAVEATEIRGIELEKKANISKISILLDKRTAYKTILLSQPPRVVLDFPETKKRVPITTIYSGHIQRLRHGKHGSNTYRLVFDLTSGHASRTYWATQQSGTLARLVLEISGEITKTTDKPSVGLRDAIVIIDAGHGGKDSGAVSKIDSKEKDIMLYIAKHVYHLLNDEYGIRALLTRADDQYVPLRKRIQIAKEQSADLFVSLHADALQQEWIYGASVYVLSEDAAFSEAARWLANHNNKVDEVGGANVKSEDKEVVSILVDLSQTATMHDSMNFAKSMYKTLKKSIHMHSQGIESGDFAVLKSLDIPSVLVELGYLSNLKEAIKLTDKRYQRHLSHILHNAIKIYLLQNTTPDMLLAKPQFVDYIVKRHDTLTAIARQYKTSIKDIMKWSGLRSDKILVGQKIKWLAINVTK